MNVLPEIHLHLNKIETSGDIFEIKQVIVLKDTGSHFEKSNVVISTLLYLEILLIVKV